MTQLQYTQQLLSTKYYKWLLPNSQRILYENNLMLIDKLVYCFDMPKCSQVPKPTHIPNLDSIIGILSFLSLIVVVCLRTSLSLPLYNPHKTYQFQQKYMQAKSLKDTFKEILFLLPDKPEDKVELFILLIHSINTKEGLINTGVRENDKEREYVGIAEGWQKAVDSIYIYQQGVYSLRYKNKEEEVIQFKFVCDLVNKDKLSINVIKVDDRTELHTLDVNLSEIDFTDEETIMLTNYIPQYKKAILQKLLPAPKQKQVINQQKEIDNYPNLYVQQSRNVFGGFPQNYGQSDLDPFSNNIFGQNNGGMLFGPQQFKQNVPRGARFDPYGPDPSINPFGQDRRFGGPPF